MKPHPLDALVNRQTDLFNSGASEIQRIAIFEQIVEKQEKIRKNNR